MRVATVLRKLLCVTSIVVQEARFEFEGLVIAVRPRRARRPRCGQCGKPGSTYDRQPTWRWKHLPLGEESWRKLVDTLSFNESWWTPLLASRKTASCERSRGDSQVSKQVIRPQAMIAWIYLCCSNITLAPPLPYPHKLQ